MLNALTVDVEDWYHVCGVEGRQGLPPTSLESRVHVGLGRILDLLGEHRVTATFFVLGSIAREAPELVRDIARRGHEVASHGDAHRRLDDLTPEAFAEDLGRSLESLSSLTGRRILGFRAPQWSLRRSTWWAFEALARAGLSYDASTVPLTGMGDRSVPPWPHLVETAAGDVLELPLTTMRCFWEHLPVSGGLPLRVTPYWFVVEVLRAANRKGWPHVVYLHPWEFDPGQPRIPLPLGKRFAHYFRLGATEERLRWLLPRFPYGPAAAVLGVS
ncbi:MAG: polysaccharide deacetylase family protein [Thermodesulfobacteriota bacterium]